MRPANSNPLNILVIEDSPADLHLLEKLLRSGQLLIGNIYTTAHVREAKKLLNQDTVDIVLLDLSLPDSSGIDSFLSLQSFALTIPVIILSGNSDEEVALKAINKGAQDFLLKSELTAGLLYRSIKYSLARNRNTKKLRESNERFRSLANLAPMFIWIAGEDANVTYANKVLLDYFGLSSNKEFIGQNWRQWVHPSDEAYVTEVFTHAYKLKEPYELECRMKAVSGEYRWLYYKGVPHYLENGRFAGFIGTAIDITQQKLAQETLEKSAEILERMVQERTHELIEANEHLKRSNTELEQFAYVASHDLQEPLRKILIFSDQLQSHIYSKMTSEEQFWLEKIRSSARRMSVLIKDLLEYSRLINKTAYEQFNTIDLKKVVEHILTDLEVVIHQKGAKVLVGNLPVIDAVEVQINQLFYNILSNSLKFIAPGRPPVIKIDIYTTAVEELKRHNLNTEKEYCKVVISDNGIGFNQEFADQIFTVFQRLHTKDKYPGTGIGLSICRKVAENHGGVIYAEGKENKGADFIIILPVQQSNWL